MPREVLRMEGILGNKLLIAGPFPNPSDSGPQSPSLSLNTHTHSLSLQWQKPVPSASPLFLLLSLLLLALKKPFPLSLPYLSLRSPISLFFALNRSLPSSISEQKLPIPAISSATIHLDSIPGILPTKTAEGFVVAFTAIEWVPEERITLFTADGLIQIGGSMVPRRIPSSDRKQGKSKTSQRHRFQESDYMDPNQRLCLGALFDIAATNGLDASRRLCILGFCRSIEMLSDAVEDTVLEHGGEIVAAEKASKGGLHEKLTMTVAVPLLWGVPPASETLHLAVQSGGGIVEKVYWQWDFL